MNFKSFIRLGVLTIILLIGTAYAQLSQVAVSANDHGSGRVVMSGQQIIFSNGYSTNFYADANRVNFLENMMFYASNRSTAGKVAVLAASITDPTATAFKTALEARGWQVSLYSDDESINTLPSMQAFDLILISCDGNGGATQMDNASFNTNVQSYVNGGGGLLVSGWFCWKIRFSSSFGAMLNAISSYTGLSSNYSWVTSYNLTKEQPSHPIYNNVSLVSWQDFGEYPNTGSLRSGATIIAKYAPYVAISASSNSPLCTGSTLSFTSAGGVSYAWTGPNGFSSSSQNPSRSNVTVADAGTYTCAITRSDATVINMTVNVVISAPPSTANAGPDFGASSAASSFSFAATTPTNGTGTWTYVSGPNTPTIATPSSPVSAVTGFITGNYVFRWTVSSGVCTSSTDLVNVVIASIPTITALSPNPVNTGQTLTITGTNFTGATSVTINATSVPFTVASATSITVVVPTGTTSGKVTVTTPGGAADGAVEITSNTTAPVSTGWTNAWQTLTTTTAGYLKTVTLKLDNTHLSNDYGLYLELHAADANPSSANPFNKFTGSSIENSATLTMLRNTASGEVTFTFPGAVKLNANATYFVRLKEAAGNPSGTGNQGIYKLSSTSGTTDGGSGNNFGTLYYKFSMAPHLVVINPPNITVTSNLTNFATCVGFASVTQSFTVNASYLTAPLDIVAPSDFEISINPTTGFASTLTLNPSGGGNTVTSPIYVRLVASATGNPSGSIVLTSTGASTVNVAVNGTLNPKPAVPTVSNVTACQDLSLPNTFLSPLTATGTNLLWYTSATGGVGSGTAPIPSASTVGTTSYWVTQTNANGCESDRARLDVIVHPVPTVNQPTNVLVQNGTTTPSVIFTGVVSPATYAWTSSNTSFGLGASGTGNIPSFTANYTGSGGVQQVVSTVVVTPSANGCVGTPKTFTITVNLNAPPTNISLSKANLFEANALGATVGNLSSTDPDVGDTHTYALVGGSGGGDNASFIILGNQLKANAVFNFAAKRLYAVRIRTTDAGGLAIEKEFLISISKIPVVLGTGNAPSTKKQTAPSANPSISKGYNSFLTVTGENLTGYSWSPGIGLSANNIANPVASPAQTTTYNVTVTNSFGSTTVVPITITVVEDYNVTPNNLLTPNGDGVNDTWAVENIFSYPNNEVKVFDKAGRLVFTQKGYANTWDASNLTPDTYYYIIIFGPEVAPKKGFITVVK